MNSSLSISQNAKNRAVIRRPMTKTSPLRKSTPVRIISTQSYSRSVLSSGKSTSYLNKRSISSLSNPSYMNDSSLIELRDRLYENPDFGSIDNDTLQKLQAYLREYKQDRAISEDYDNAEKASYLIELVKVQLSKKPNDSNSVRKNLDSSSSISENENLHTNQDKKSDKETNSDANSELKNDDEKKRLKEFEEKWKTEFEKFDDLTEHKTKELEEKQSKQLEEFEKVWSTEKPQKYRKPSTHLLQLKKIERTLALTGEFDQARLIHSEAEQLAAKEQQALQSALIRDYRSAKESFQSKQNQEKQQFLQIRLEARSTMEIHKNAEYNKLIKRNVVIQEKWKDAQRASRERSGQIKPDYGVSVSNFNQNKVKFTDNIIPPLFAPNDPTFVEEDERKTREKKKKQLELQKKNADQALLEYTLQPSPRANDEEDKNGINKQELLQNEGNVNINIEDEKTSTIKDDEEKTYNKLDHVINIYAAETVQNGESAEIISNSTINNGNSDIINDNNNVINDGNNVINDGNNGINYDNNVINDDNNVVNDDNNVVNDDNNVINNDNNVINDNNNVVSNNRNNDIINNDKVTNQDEKVEENNNENRFGQLTSVFGSILNNSNKDENEVDVEGKK